MEVASLELCKELYELSGWENTSFYHDISEGFDEYHLAYSSNKKLPVDGGLYPAYDLGYLIRKLPVDTQMNRLSNGDWGFKSQTFARVADTPEDAACKLIIELFKQGILSGIKGDNHNG